MATTHLTTRQIIDRIARSVGLPTGGVLHWDDAVVLADTGDSLPVDTRTAGTHLIREVPYTYGDSPFETEWVEVDDTDWDALAAAGARIR